MTRKRKLREEERALWDQVARTAVPLNAAVSRPRVLAMPDPAQKADMEKMAIGSVPHFEVGSKSKPQTRIPPSEAKKPPTMDAKAFRKMSKGKLSPEGRIDLHGMTVDQAHPELINFILRSHAKGRRLVLVITGKGQRSDAMPIPYQRGILRRQVPHWLRQNPVAPLILEVTQASLKHGGEGALYVYLKRRR